MSHLTYTDPAVRDLAWSLSSPPLLRRHDTGLHWPNCSWFTGIGEQFRNSLVQLDADPRPLRQILSRRRDRRLGSYFEALWRYWLEHNPRYCLLHANLPVRVSGSTLGEFDFIVRDRESGKTLHWELAVKFYLGSGNTRQPANWLGPGKRDRLDIKTDRLLLHQSRLSRHPLAQALLAERAISIDETWIIMKGRLFYPCGGAGESPAGADPGHLRGFWLPARELYRLRQARWLILAKHQWLAPLAKPAATTMNNRELGNWWRDAQPQYPACVAGLVNGIELERGFIVPDRWAPDNLPCRL